MRNVRPAGRPINTMLSSVVTAFDPAGDAENDNEQPL